jgi:hypothetical protein
MLLNRNKRCQRVQNGKPMVFHDRSMDKHFKVEPCPATSNELRDLTDRENDEVSNKFCECIRVLTRLLVRLCILAGDFEG